MKLESGYVLNKCFMTLKRVIGVLRFYFVSIKGTLKLSFRFEIQKLNVTIASVSTSVLFAAFVFKSVAFVPRKDPKELIFMSLNCFFSHSLLIRLLITPVSHSPSNCLNFMFDDRQACVFWSEVLVSTACLPKF